MAYIEEEIRDLLLADSTLVGYISTRIWYLRADSTTIRPYIVYAVVSDPDNRKYVGGDASQPRFQFSIVADNPISAKQVEEALRDVLWEYTGTIGGIVVDRIKPVARRDMWDLDNHVIIQRDFIVEYRR